MLSNIKTYRDNVCMMESMYQSFVMSGSEVRVLSVALFYSISLSITRYNNNRYVFIRLNVSLVKLPEK